jgi:SNF2 family DNA or RNA helicase
LLDQWASEIKKHTNCDLAVMRYASGNRVDSNRAGTIIDGHDIVLTTWDEVRKSYPKFKPPVSCETDGEKLEWWIEEHKENRGNLHRIEFLRIVLDEAQAIKNHKSQTSIACRGLIARHKWAMSGTPILNGLFELYPYFKFIGVPHTGDFEDFEENYCNIAAGPAGVDRLHIRLSQFMLRRTHSDKMFGAPILKLPRADQSTYWCDFNPVERIVYDIVWKRFLERMAEMLANTGSKKEKKGPTYGKDNESEEERSYNCILVLFLRLRQLCSHILMLQFVMKDLCELEDIKMIEEVVRTNAANRDSSSGRTIIAIRKQLDDLSKQQASKVIDSDDEDLGDDTNSTADATADATEDGLDDETSLDITTHSTEERQRSGRSFGKAFDFDPFLKSLKAGPEHEQRKKRALCSWCGKPAQAPWSMSCSHLICKEPCMEEVNIAIAEQGNEHSACKTCGTVPDFIHPGEDEGSETPDLVSHGTRSGKRKNRKRTHIEREVFPKNWLETIDDELLPSTKTIAVKAQILNWIKEDKDVKIIVFTQFLPM